MKRPLYANYLVYLVFLDNRIEFDELALMVLAVVDEVGELRAYGLDVVEARQRHVAIQVGGGGTWVYGEDLYRRVGLLELDGHHTHHRVLSRLAGNISQRMPVGTDF